MLWKCFENAKENTIDHEFMWIHWKYMKFIENTPKSLKNLKSTEKHEKAPESHYSTRILPVIHDKTHHLIASLPSGDMPRRACPMLD